MSAVQDLERAITQLSQDQLREFRAWFAEHDGQLWDQQFENDVLNGRLDALADEAIEDVRQGRSTDL
jgi:hypothetical protein